MEFYLDFDQLLGRFAGQLGVLALPLFFIAIAVEGVFVLRREHSYPWKSAGVSILVTAGHMVSQAAVHGIIFGIIAYGVYAVRLTTIPVSFDRPALLILLFLLADLAFYGEHRCSHRIRLLWAAHSVHHSTERMVMPAAFRLSWTPILSGVFAFYLPIVWIGFDPVWVFGVVSASLVYQFFIHTELVPRLGWLEGIINTPSAHRVHHASNPEYVDQNFGGVLMIWDRLFGTYAAERPDIVIRYGLSHPRASAVNPFVIAYEDYWAILKDFWKAPSWRARLAFIAGPPG